MAEQLKPNGDGAEPHIPHHNIEAINSTIRNKFHEILKTDRDIKKLEEQHIAELKSDRTQLWKNMAADTDVSQTDLKLFYKLWKRQEEAKLFDEEEDANAVSDNLKVIFEALADGDQLDFIDGIRPENDTDANGNGERIH